MVPVFRVLMATGVVLFQPLPHLSELAVAKLPDELEAAALDLPLVPGVVTQVGRGGFLHLGAGLPQVDTETVSVPAVVVHQLLQGPECCSPGDEKPSLVQLADSVMFDGVTVPDTQREIVPPTLAVSDQEGSVFVLR